MQHGSIWKTAAQQTHGSAHLREAMEANACGSQAATHRLLSGARHDRVAGASGFLDR